MKNWIIGLFMVSFFVLGFVYIQSYFLTTYGLVDDVQLSSNYNVYNETSAIVGQSSEDLLNKSSTSGSSSEGTIQGAWATIKNIVRIVPITYRLLSRASQDMGFPPWMLPIFISMILTTIIFWMIYWVAGLLRPKV